MSALISETVLATAIAGTEFPFLVCPVLAFFPFLADLSCECSAMLLPDDSSYEDSDALDRDL